MRLSACRALGLGMLAAFLLLGGTAQGAQRQSQSVSGADYQVTGWKMKLSARFSWTGQNEWAKGSATNTETLHRSGHVSGKDGELIVVGKTIAGGVSFPVRLEHKEKVTSKAPYNPPQTCTGSGQPSELDTVAGLFFKNAGQSSEAHTLVTVTWPVPDIFGCGYDGLKTDTVKTIVALAELTNQRVVHLHAEETIPLKPAAGMSGKGAVDWEASITLKQLSDS